MSEQQEGDVLICQTPDGGEIFVRDGVTEMTPDFRSAAYLSLFGGNEQDNGSDGNPNTWWGNILESDPALKMISRTQYLLRNIPATSGNLRRIEDAVRQDLQWFIDKKIANEIADVEAIIPSANRVKISGSINAVGEETAFEFTENWGAVTNGT